MEFPDILGQCFYIILNIAGPFRVVNFLLLLVKKKLILPAALPLSVLPGRRITASLSQPVYTKTAPGTYRMQLESHTEFQKTSSTKFAELTLHESYFFPIPVGRFPTGMRPFQRYQTN